VFAVRAGARRRRPRALYRSPGVDGTAAAGDSRGAHVAAIAGQAVFVGGWTRPYLESLFTSAALVARFHDPYGVTNDEWGVEVWLCRGQKRPWKALLPQLKNHG
jgi:hypothetical protein